MAEIYIQHWTESERGWGSRPDGISIHNSIAERDAFVADYNAKFNNKKEVPDEYSYADGQPKFAVIDDDLFATL